MVKGSLLWHESLQMINGKDPIHSDKILDMQKEARKLIDDALKDFHENQLGLLEMEAKEVAEISMITFNNSSLNPILEYLLN